MRLDKNPHCPSSTALWPHAAAPPAFVSSAHSSTNATAHSTTLMANAGQLMARSKSMRGKRPLAASSAWARYAGAALAGAAAEGGRLPVAEVRRRRARVGLGTARFLLLRARARARRNRAARPSAAAFAHAVPLRCANGKGGTQTPRKPAAPRGPGPSTRTMSHGRWCAPPAGTAPAGSVRGAWRAKSSGTGCPSVVKT